MQNVERKLKTVLETYNKLLPSQKSRKSIPLNVRDLGEEYHRKFLSSMEIEEHPEGIKPMEEEEEELLEDAKISHSVPNRKQLKAQSARLVEELSKREE